MLFYIGELPEWLNGAVSKTVVSAREPWVQIPDSPPLISVKAFNNISYYSTASLIIIHFP